ncbi:MAG: amino acid permease [Bacillales bacterium]|jgi:APA family basic amino acid/polyamine antiporter|nr:amino acid permease [Bacillales bacterium]
MENIKEHNTELKREISLSEAIMIVIGVVIGSGIFFKASVVFSSAGSTFYGLMAWVVGGFITISSALTIAEIAAAIPKTGGVFIYLKELYSERLAFLYGWMQTLIYVPAVCAALSIVFVTQATYFIELSEMEQKILAIAIIIFLATLNTFSTKAGSKLNFVFTIAKLVPIIIIITFGLMNGTNPASITGDESVVSPFAVAGFGAAILGTLWAYDGWVSVGNIAGELKNPQRDLPRAIIIGLSVIIAVYLLINVAIVKVMPIADVISSEKAASDAAVVLFGNSGASLVAAGIMISIFGALNGYLLTGVRIPYAMAKENLFPYASTFSKLSKFGTPLNIFIFEVILSILYVLSGSFNTLTDLVVFVVWIFFVFIVAGIFILRKKFAHLPKPYKVPLYPFFPIVGILGGIYILGSTLVTSTQNAVIGILITLTGLPVYAIIKKNQNANSRAN